MERIVIGASAEIHVPLLFLGGIVVLGLIWLVGTYNGLVRLKQHCRESWSDIDTELRRRYDLVPNLVETVKGYAAHEKQVLEAVISARSRAVASSGSAAAQAADENMLVGALRQLFAVSEGYPELKASTNFLHLQQELANTEDRIQAARRFYNANVRDMNTRTEVFPSNLIANMFGFTREEFFEVESAAVRAASEIAL
ncbi:MAG: LemA family protein [Planctomycetota bacterium]|jgi:LemA protein